MANHRWRFRSGDIFAFLVFPAAISATMAFVLTQVEARMPTPVFGLGFWGHFLVFGLAAAAVLAYRRMGRPPRPPPPHPARP